MSRGFVRNSRKKFAAASILALLVLTGSVFGFKNSQASSDITARNDDTLAAVSKLVVLPEDEKPSITSVIDKTKVGQPFLQNAENGDQVLLYLQSGKAIVYRPSTNKIVNMGPLEVPKPRVFIRDGRSGEIPEDFSEKISGTGEFVVTSQDKSAKQDYAETVIVDVSGGRPDAAKKLSTLLGIKIIELPKTETRPDADVLVIVGND